jgi:uncharacterized cupredoxin-like copper-binding protein
MLTHQTIRRTSLAALSVLAAGSALGACGSSNDNSGTTSTTSTAATATSTAAGSTMTGSSTTAASGVIKLTADPNGALAFDRKTITAKAGKVTLSMLNPASTGVPHAVAVEGNGVDQNGKTVDPGGTSTVSVTLKPGTYTYYCPVPGHKQAGMVGTLTVK